MLETEEVDVDYFTPASSTSLSKIFSNTVQPEEGQENSSLKYIPPLPTQSTPKPEDEKPTQYVLYVMTVNAYEWLNETYVSKERVGFVILKVIKSGLHNIILYDSNKTVLSCLTLTAKTEINIKEDVSISFYDNQRKYWSVYTNPFEINKILGILKDLNISLKCTIDTEKDLSKEYKKIDNIDKSSEVVNQSKNDCKESDTDSSVNRRTKDSILKRMATMGQSVLPPTHIITHTSDSSDTNESKNQHKVRHKPLKTNNKRNIEKNTSETENKNDSHVKKIVTKPLLLPEIGTKINTNKQIVATKINDIVPSPANIVSDGNDNMTLFISEQRVSNSELRINVNRITDKLDLVLEKVKDLTNTSNNSIGSNTSQLQNEITYKLLNEYEKKIKSYEAFIKSKGFHCDTFEPIDQISHTNSDKHKETRLSDYELLCEQKDRQITQLKEEVQTLCSKLEDIEQKNNDSNLKEEINKLKECTRIQKDEIDKLNKKIEVAQSNKEVINKLKSIMNETFQTISVNFDSDTSYTGTVVKNMVGTVIKKTTVDCLKQI